MPPHEFHDRRFAMRTGNRARAVDEHFDVVHCAVESQRVFRARQVEAACLAGKRAILCEKPLVTTRAEAKRVAAVARDTGVPIIVGTMHTFDPGWVALDQQWGKLAADIHTVRSTIIMPPNPSTEDKATDIVGRPGPAAAGEAGGPDLQRDAEVAASGVMGLAIHNLPHLRRIIPTIDAVEYARALSPWGYVITLSGGGRTAELVGYIHSQWRLSWTLDAISDKNHIHVEFPPSYVHVGSARSQVTADGTTVTSLATPENGYLEEWRRVAAVVAGSQPAPDLQGLLDDVCYAIDIADRARTFILEGSAA